MTGSVPPHDRAPLRIIAEAALKTIVLAAGIGLAASLLLIDVLLLDNRVGEESLTEIAGECVLLATAVVFGVAARRPGSFGFCSLAAGFFACMLIRELDALLDLVRHGLWQYPAFATAIIACGLAWRDRANALARVAEFTAMPCFGLMAAGLVTILVFSRLFGLSAMWHHVLGSADTNFVKRATEETAELFGYSLCLAAGIEYVRTTRFSRSQAPI